MFRSLVVVFGVALIGLSGCAAPKQSITTNVIRYNSLPHPLPAAPTVAFREPARSLETACYQAMVLDQLAKKKWLAAPAATADYLIELECAINKGNLQVISSPVIGMINAGGSNTVRGTEYTPNGPVEYTARATVSPTYGQIGTREQSEYKYRRAVVLRLIDRRTNAVVYRVQAISDGLSPDVAFVMPAMVQSIFNDFPAKNGTAAAYSIPD